MSNRNLLVLLLIALHPVWNLARAIGGVLFALPVTVGLSLTFPVVEVAWVVQLFVTAGLMTYMRGPANASPRSPAGLETTVSGFRFRLGTGPDPIEAIKHLGLAAFASTWGMALLLGVAVYARPGDYPPIPGWIFVSVNLVAHLVLQTVVLGGATLLRMALARRFDIALEGRVLRVGHDSLTLSGDHQIAQGSALTVTQGSDALTITGPSSALSWLATELEKVQPDGAESDVPDTLKASRLQHTKGRLNPS